MHPQTIFLFFFKAARPIKTILFVVDAQPHIIAAVFYYYINQIINGLWSFELLSAFRVRCQMPTNYSRELIPYQPQNTRLFSLVIIYLRHMFFCILLQEELFYVLHLLFPCGAAVEMKLMKQRDRRKGGGAEILREKCEIRNIVRGGNQKDRAI